MGAAVRYWTTLATVVMSLSVFWVTPASAHFRGLTDTAIEIARPGVRIVYTVVADDLLELRPGAAGGVLGSPEDYLAPVIDGWLVSSGDRACVLDASKAAELPDLAAYQYQLTWRCPQGLDSLAISYRVFEATQPEHENFARVFMAGRLLRWRFTAQHDRLVLPVAARLDEWRSTLDEAFLGSDPNRRLGAAGVERPAPAPGLSTSDWIGDQAFVRLGMEHILLGIDHVVFVMAILLIPTTLRRLLVWISMFTVAHSITLALAFFDVLRISPALTEPLIALTILAVGLENLWICRDGVRGIAWRPLFLFAFGLIHGVGLSYQLNEISVGSVGPDLGRLLLFNLGVELGQLVIILATAWPLHQLVRTRPEWRLATWLSLLVAMAGAGWFVARVA